MTRKQLVDGLIRGEERAWRLFLQDYGRMIYAVATRLGLSEPDRDDLFQEACRSILESIHTLRDPKRLASWVYVVTYRLGIDTIRRRPEMATEDWENLQASQPAAASQPKVLEELERLEETAHLMDALAEMDPRCRRLLEALYLEDPRPTYEQVSRRQGLPVGSIGPTRARCLEKLGKSLEGLSARGRQPSNSRKENPLSNGGLSPDSPGQQGEIRRDA